MSSPSQPGRAPASNQEALRCLPAVEELLLAPSLAALSQSSQRGGLIDQVRATLDEWRARIKAGEWSLAQLETKLAAGELV
ncbi:MAG: hypothetical protein ABIP42_02700, partial [Planctomycetota bacterium]